MVSCVLFNVVLVDLSGKLGDESDRCYENMFLCVWCGVLLMLVYDFYVDLLLVYLMMVVVVGLEGEEVFCDEMGCIWV